jgi:hypothetical protein
MHWTVYVTSENENTINMCDRRESFNYTYKHNKTSVLISNSKGLNASIFSTVLKKCKMCLPLVECYAFGLFCMGLDPSKVPKTTFLHHPQIQNTNLSKSIIFQTEPAVKVAVLHARFGFNGARGRWSDAGAPPSEAGSTLKLLQSSVRVRSTTIKINSHA